jgi:hypothetical protein
MKKHVQYYFAAMKKEDNTLFLSKTKIAIANFLNINPKTIARQLYNTSMYENNSYIIWCNIKQPAKLKTGFAIRLPNRYTYS